MLGCRSLSLPPSTVTCRDRRVMRKSRHHPPILGRGHRGRVAEAAVYAAPCGPPKTREEKKKNRSLMEARAAAATLMTGTVPRSVQYHDPHHLVAHRAFFRCREAPLSVRSALTLVLVQSVAGRCRSSRISFDTHMLPRQRSRGGWATRYDHRDFCTSGMQAHWPGLRVQQRPSNKTRSLVFPNRVANFFGGKACTPREIISPEDTLAHRMSAPNVMLRGHFDTTVEHRRVARRTHRWGRW